MKILWVCNVALPEIAQKLNMEVSNKEGWLSGMIHGLLQNCGENTKESQNNSAPDGLQIAIAFPLSAGMEEHCTLMVEIEGAAVECYGFYEDVRNPEIYDAGLEQRLAQIIKAAQPDILHCFGTEYPHTLAACRVFPRKDRILVGIQGLCTLLAKAYFANLPEKVIRSKTLRDILRKDSIVQQQEKFTLRGKHEVEIVKLAGNITGRTGWDRENTGAWNKNARYFEMNESLRASFYEAQWQAEECIPHTIFLSQGDYPLKGLHYMLLALPEILEKYPDAKVYVAGNSLVAYGTWKEKLKISAYGKYLRSLIKKYHLEDKVVFLGRMTETQMRTQYLKSHLFVCCSSLENSSNSLGEAMLLGMPCVCADVGGLPSIFEAGTDGIMYKGYRNEKNNICDEIKTGVSELDDISRRLACAVVEMWGNPEKMKEYCRNARNHARKTHDKNVNRRKMTEIYAKIMGDSTRSENMLEKDNSAE